MGINQFVDNVEEYKKNLFGFELDHVDVDFDSIISKFGDINIREFSQGYTIHTFKLSDTEYHTLFFGPNNKTPHNRLYDLKLGHQMTSNFKEAVQLHYDSINYLSKLK